MTPERTRGGDVPTRSEHDRSPAPPWPRNGDALRCSRPVTQLVAVIATVIRGVRRAAQVLRGSDTLIGLARVGLAGRGLFYLILTYLVLRIAVRSTAGQADANGVFRTITAQPFGTAAVLLADVGILAFGIARIAAAVGDRGVSGIRRVTAAGQGGTYLMLAGFTTYFLISAGQSGSTKVGSEQTHQSGAGSVLAEPAGRGLLAILGVGVVVVCLWQIWNAVRQNYVTGIADQQMPRVLRWLLRFAGTVGIAARAASIVPIGVLYVAAAATGRPGEAKGLDSTLHQLAGRRWGLLLLGLMAAGFGLFAIYSFLEAGYRQVSDSS